KRQKGRQDARKGQKTYDAGDSLIVTDPTTSLTIRGLMYRNKRVMKKQLWIQETGASQREPPFVWKFCPFQTEETVLSSYISRG
ncbi:hypothetical protein B0T18DRAFT_332225, partial [Schizothecium vesticola]